MKAREWLGRATQDLPAGVTARVEADTLGHLQDAGVDEEADVRRVLGPPDATKRELTRLYLTNEEYLKLQRQRTGWARWGNELSLLIWSALLLNSRFLPFHGNAALWTTYAAILAGFLLAVLRLPAQRRRLWLEFAALLSAWIVYFSFLSFAASPLVQWLAPLPLILAARRFGQTWQQDARLARTLALGGERT